MRGSHRGARTARARVGVESLVPTRRTGSGPLPDRRSSNGSSLSRRLVVGYFASVPRQRLDWYVFGNPPRRRRGRIRHVAEMLRLVRRRRIARGGQAVRIAVVGGGPAGLTAAYRLCAAGHDPHVLEAAVV